MDGWMGYPILLRHQEHRQSDANKIEIELETDTSLYFIAYC